MVYDTKETMQLKHPNPSFRRLFNGRLTEPVAGEGLRRGYPHGAWIGAWAWRVYI